MRGRVSQCHEAFVVDAQRIFAIANDRLLSYNGSYFTQYAIRSAIPFPNDYQLWAGSDVVSWQQRRAKCTSTMTAARTPDSAHPGREGGHLAVGFARDDLWVGSDRRSPGTLQR